MSGKYLYESVMSKDLLEFAEREINEKSSWRDRDIQALRDMVQKNDEVKCSLESSFLLRFLRAKKFDYEHAYLLLVNYFVTKASNLQQLDKLIPSKCEDLIDEGLIVLLPSKDLAERKVIYVRVDRWIPSKIPMMRLLRIITLTMEQVIRDEETQIRGVSVVVNASGMGYVHLRHTNTTFLSTVTELLQRAFPLRISGIHFIHEPLVFSIFFKLMKPFLTHDLLSKHHFHGSSVNSLHKVIGAHALPKELEGDLQSGDVLAKAWKEELMATEEYFQGLHDGHVNLSASHSISPYSTSYCFPGMYYRKHSSS